MSNISEILKQVFFDNTLQDYLIAGIAIFLGFLFKRLIAHYVVKLFGYVIKQRYRNTDPSLFKKLIARPLGLFIAVLITIVALDRLKFPAALDFKLYKIRVEELLRMVGTTLLIVSFFRFLIKAVDFAVLLVKDRYMQNGDQGNYQLVFFFKDFIKVVIGFLGAMLILKYTFGQNLGSLITGLSIVGAAIALALKESLENLIASFIIFFDKPFQTGDAVKVNSVSGFVEKIGLRSTRIRTDAKTFVTVPNKQMVDSVMDNLTQRTQRRGDLKLEIARDTPQEQVDALLDGLRKLLSMPDVQNFNLYFTEISANALIITADYYTEPDNFTLFSQIRQTINLKAIALMSEMGIESAGSSTNIHIVNAKD